MRFHQNGWETLIKAGSESTGPLRHCVLASHLKFPVAHSEFCSWPTWILFNVLLIKLFIEFTDKVRRSTTIKRDVERDFHQSLKGLILKLKLQYFGHLIWRADSLEKTLMVAKIEGGRRRGWLRINVWRASPTQWIWVWVSSGSWFWTGSPGLLQSMGSQRVRHNWVTDLRRYSLCGEDRYSFCSSENDWWVMFMVRKLQEEHRHPKL